MTLSSRFHQSDDSSDVQPVKVKKNRPDRDESIVVNGPAVVGPASVRESDLVRRLAQLERDYHALQLTVSSALNAQSNAEQRLREIRDVVASPQQKEEIRAIESGHALMLRIAAQEAIAIESVRQALAGTNTRQQQNRFTPVRSLAQQRAKDQQRDAYGREPLTTDEPLLTWLSTPDATGLTPYHRIRTVRPDAWRNLMRTWKVMRPYVK